jgi:hypothetical protein
MGKDADGFVVLGYYATKGNAGGVGTIPCIGALK